MGDPKAAAPAKGDPKAAAPAAEKAPKEKKAKGPSFVVKLRDKASNVLRFTAKGKANGSAVSFATYSVPSKELNAKGKPKKVHQRGASASHPNFDAAKAAVEAGAEQAVKLGWAKRGSKSGGSKKDVFDLANLPKPVSEVALPAAQ